MFRFFSKSIRFMFSSLHLLIFVGLIIYTVAITTISGVATAITAGLGYFGISTAVGELSTDLIAQKKVTKSLEAENLKLQKNQGNLKVRLANSEAAQKRMSTQIADNKKVRDTTTRVANKMAQRNIRIIASNVATEGMSWIPLIGAAIGVSAVAYEISEMCDQQDELDELLITLGSPPANRGAFSYLCKSDETFPKSADEKVFVNKKRKVLEYDGKRYVQVYPDEIYSSPVFRLHDKYNSLLRANKINAAKRLKGVSFASYRKANDLTIFSIDENVLVQRDGVYYQLPD